MACNKDHSKLERKMLSLSTDQGGVGRHKCTACAYEAGYQAGDFTRDNYPSGGQGEGKLYNELKKCI